MSEFADALISRVRDLLPSGIQVVSRSASYAAGGPGAGVVTVAVDYASAPAAPRLLTVAADLDIWTRGPDETAADALAAALEQGLVGWRANTARQGTVRLWSFTRAGITEPDEKLAHVSMRFNGRGIRRTNHA